MRNIGIKFSSFAVTFERSFDVIENTFYEALVQILFTASNLRTFFCLVSTVNASIAAKNR